MGRFAAIELAHRGAEVVVVGHTDTRGVAASIRARGSGAGSTLELHPRLRAGKSVEERV